MKEKIQDQGQEAAPHGWGCLAPPFPPLPPPPLSLADSPGPA